MQWSSPQNAMEPSARQSSSDKFLTLLLLTFPGIVLLLYSYLGTYARLIADDFCSFYYAQRLGTLRYVWHEYLTWGGRYSAFAVDSLIAYIGTEGLPYFPVTVLVIWVIISSFTFNALLQVETGKRPGLLLALALGITTVFTMLAVSPRPQDTLYWWNGMRTYLPALLIATFHVGFLYWAVQNLMTRNAILLGSLVSFLIALVNGGGNEAFSVILILFFAGILALNFGTNRLRFRDPLFLFLAAAILGDALALLIMLLSPGTEVRQVFFPSPPSISRIFMIAASGYLGYLLDLLRSPQRISALIAITLTFIWIGMTSNKKLSREYWILVPVAAGILLSFVSLLPVIYATSELPPPRTLIIFSFLIVIGFLYAGLNTGKWLSGRDIEAANLRWGLIACAALSVLVSTAINAKALYDSRETYSSFARRWDQANAQILQARSNGEESVTIPALNVWTGPGGDPTDNPRYWVTACTSRYYDFQVFGPPLNMTEPENHPNE